MRFLACLEKQRTPFLIFIGITLIGVVGFLDFLTGYEYAFSVFYVLPIALITWSTNRRTGLVASLASAFVWFAADIASQHPYSRPFLPFWNALIRFSFFVIITLLLSALRSALRREADFARIDYLTGAVNSRAFYELLQVEMNRLRRYHHCFTLAYIDLDNFKAVNDQFGHTTGDEILLTVVTCIRKNIRSTDVIARLGGDEFIVLFPETSSEEARDVLPNIQRKLLAEMQRKNWPVTFSIGVTTCKSASATMDELVGMADALMYSVKNTGKNAIRYSEYTGKWTTA